MESEGTFSSEQCEHNVESLALNVMEQDQSGENISLFLEDWKGGFELPHRPGFVVPENWRTYFSQLSSSSSSSQNWWQHEHQDSQWREHQDTLGKLTNGEITSGEKSDYRLFAKPMWQPLCKILAHSYLFFQGVSLTGNSDSLVSDGGC